MAETRKKHSKASSISRAFQTGLVSGAITTALFQPFELVKTRMQKARCVSDGRPSMMVVTRSVLKNEGFIGLWNGLTPALARAIPGVGLYFAFMHGMKTVITNEERAMTSMEAAFVGGASRITAGAILMPVTVLKTRYESGLFKYAGVLDGLRTIARQEGFMKLFSGMVPSIIRDLPFSSAYLGFYTHAQKWMTADLVGVGTNVISLTLIHASYAGIMSSILTHPPDVVRTRMQLHAKAEPMKLVPAINSVYSDFGMLGFFRGLLPRLLRRTLVSCVSWTMYEAAWFLVNLDIRLFSVCNGVDFLVTCTGYGNQSRGPVKVNDGGKNGTFKGSSGRLLPFLDWSLSLDSFVSKGASISKAFRSGLLGGAITPTLLQPLELVKTRMQRTGGSPEGRTSMVHVIRSVIRNEGFFQLWNGLTPALVRSIPGVGIYFGCMETLKTMVTRGTRPMTTTEGAVVGASARFVATGVLMPATVLKTRFESGLFQYRGLSDAVKTIIRQEGSSRLFAGMVPVMVRDLPYASAYLAFYTHSQAWMRAEWFGLDENSTSLTLLRTAYAGVMASTLTHPPDVIKTRLQLNVTSERVKLLSAIVAIHSESGMAGYFRGLLPRLMRRPLVSVIQWTFYDTLMKR